MKITDGIEPHSLAWVNARCGKITASEIHKLFIKGTGGRLISVGGLTYLNKKIGEILTRIMSDDVPETDDIQRGLAGEIFAIERYTEITGIDVNPSMLYEYNAIASGTTDGNTSRDKVNIHGIIEAKAPRAHIHQQILAVDAAIELKAINPQYYNQPQANILFTDAEHADFISYNESFVNRDLQIRIIRLYPDLEWRKEFVNIIDFAAGFFMERIEKIMKAPERNLAYRIEQNPQAIEKLKDAIENISNIKI